PKEFKKPSCVQMRFMEFINAFVIDLDNIRSYNLDVAIKKIDLCPIKPNYIVNSGNGLHLYFILKEKFDFLSYTTAVSWARNVKRVREEGRKKKRYVIATADKIKDVYSEMLKWYDDPSYKADKLHLAHGIRMFGGKTKNSRILSTVYKGYDERYDLETIAEMVGVELLTEDERNRLWPEIEGNSDVSATQVSLLATDPEKSDHKEQTPTITEPEPIARIDYKLLSEKLKQFLEIHKRELMPKRMVPKWTPYNYLVASIKEYNYVGIRNKCLFIMACHGYLYQISEDVVKKDIEDMATHMNEITPDDPITQENIENAFDGYFSGYRYTNHKITEITGIPFEKTQKEARRERSQSRQATIQKVLQIVDIEYSKNKLVSLRDLSNILKTNGVKRGKSFLSTDPDVINIREKYRKIQ
ncbi:hypothetical protein, partial [Geomonas propionica]